MNNWKKIDDSNYSVSSEGQVRNASGLIMKPSNDKDGYYRVVLSKNGKKKTHYVHRLVASAFIPLENGKDFVDHKDGEPTNNSVENLRWATRQQNNQNKSIAKNNTSGVKGVDFHNGKWRARICIDRKRIYLGYFESIEEAGAVRSARANQVFGVFTHSSEKV